MQQQGAERGPTGDVSVSRKADHLRINIEQDVRAKGISAGFERFRFLHCALPEIALDDVDLAVTCFGRTLRAPVLISSMTGGTPEAAVVNRMLAAVAQEFGFAMGLGSGRVMLEEPRTRESFDVRSVAPDVLLFANLGAVQLNKGYGAAQCRRMIELVGADALMLHLNPLQEALQPEGDTDFRGLLARIASLCRELEVPVLVKEVGWGLRADIVRALFDAGVAGVDVAGAGGTSWSEVERHRTQEHWRVRVAAQFAGWGIPTAQCVAQARGVAPGGFVIASGGIRDGLDAAKAIALGADLAGIAGPFLRAAARGAEDVRSLSREIVEVLRITMFAVGLRSIEELKSSDVLVPA
ncbi:MAG TPA: type 2 isopentenyl-diphosphate Delta-isomerase [Candidatus Acidoferrales bacterium]|nr:type 2 isopentenyl-diphosphate Delta-isomerase [Candidatus Acidoferrales bacterium]